MKTFTKSLSGLLSASALAIGLSVVTQAAVAGIDGSRHDLAAATETATTTTQICVFCHTPHGANLAVDAPLWNKGSTGSTYLAYNSPTMDGVADTGSVSLACLTCHDGTQAVDNMINKPGSGGYTPAGSPLGVTGPISAGIVNLGTDLSNDHPIGMTYCGAAGPQAVADGACGDDSFNFTIVGGDPLGRMWIDTAAGTVGTFEKSDFPLFAGGTGASVECATCHDPHTPTNGTFLRVSNTGSAVCLTCHAK